MKISMKIVILVLYEFIEFYLGLEVCKGLISLEQVKDSLKNRVRTLFRFHDPIHFCIVICLESDKMVVIGISCFIECTDLVQVDDRVILESNKHQVGFLIMI